MKFPIPHKVKPGKNDDFDFTTRSGVHESIQVNTLSDHSLERTRRHLGRLKHNINCQKCTPVDSVTQGDKYTTCNWGLCTDDPEVYSEPKDHLFPYQFMNDGRVAPLYNHPCQCPFDKREEGSGNSGCLYHCRIFKDGLRDKETALELVQIKIDLIESKMKE